MSENLFDPMTQAREPGASAIDEPIINRPNEEPGAMVKSLYETYESLGPTDQSPRRLHADS